MKYLLAALFSTITISVAVSEETKQSIEFDLAILCKQYEGDQDFVKPCKIIIDAARKKYSKHVEAKRLDALETVKAWAKELGSE